MSDRKRWAILARRSGESKLGGATAWCQSKGEVLLFDTEEKAAARAEKYNVLSKSANVSYSAEPFEERSR